MDRISRRDFFMSLVAVGVAAGLPLPLGVPRKPLPPGEYEMQIEIVSIDLEWQVMKTLSHVYDGSASGKALKIVHPLPGRWLV